MARPGISKLMQEGKVDEAIDRLNIRQRSFVDEYFVDFNAAAAVLRAGYKTKYPNRVGYELLKQPHIKAAVDRKNLERASQSVIKPDYVIKKVVRTIEAAEESNNHNAVLKGCELLARHLGMFIERTEISGPDGGAIKYEQVKEAADAFTSAISSLIEREGTNEVPLIVERRD